MNKFLKYALMCLAIGLVFVAPNAFAAESSNIRMASTNPFDSTIAVLLQTFKNVRAVVYVAGAFALVGMAVASMLGKISWKWLAAVAIALAIVAMSGAIVDYATGRQENRVSSVGGEVGDTLNTTSY